MKHLALTALLSVVPVTAQAQDIVYDFNVTLNCLEGATEWWQKRECIGAAAGACMEATPGGYSTLGMSECTHAEYEDWDRVLNEVYGPVRKLMAEFDADEADYPGPIKRADALRDMQRAWIAFRDAACDFERSRWGRGTGGGPAQISCLMDETARQALRLQLELEYN